MTRRPPENKTRVLILGGGASGLAAACVLAQRQVPFLLLEKEAKPGRKLLATGNGRCNLMNLGEPVYFGDSAFARQVLSFCGVTEVLAFFHGLGLGVTEEEEGRVYPLTRQAASVLDCLLAGAQASPCGELRFGQAVTAITRTAAGFRVETTQGQAYEAPRVLVCTGSPAAPRLGGSGALAEVLVGLGHTLLPWSPALSALITNTAPIRGLSGQRFPATLTLFDGEAAVCAAAGEALFTDYGVSGLCAMQLARDAFDGLKAGRQVTLALDFSALLGLRQPLYRRLALHEANPTDSAQRILALLRERLDRLGRNRLYTGLLPAKLAEALLGLDLREAADTLAGFRLSVTGVKGFDQAQVAAGGLCTRDFDPETLESRRVPGLYAGGEILNVDGDTGGFNLLFAWACGILAARAAGAQG